MGDTSPVRDASGQRAAAGAARLGGGADHFRARGAPAPAGDHFRPPNGKARAPDAFAPRGRNPATPRHGDPTGAGFYNPFAPRAASAPAQPAPAASAPSVAPPAPQPQAAPLLDAQARRPVLHVVAADTTASVAVPAVGLSGRRDLGQADLRMKERRRSSSMVLVSPAGPVAAAETLEAPPPPVAERAPPPAAPPPQQVAPKPTSRGRGGGGPGGGAAPPPARFNQDDLVGIVLGAGVLILLLLWLLRGRDEAPPGDAGQLLTPQSAANEPAVAPPPPLPPDPFGNAPVDLRPTGPPPEPTPETSEAATLRAEPAPAAPEAAIPDPPRPITADMTMHAWFCTKQSTLTAKAQRHLEHSVGQFAQAFEGHALVVRGYADTRGTPEFNASLSGARASVVADFLRARGLNIVEVSGVGELQGLADEQDCANQRRVDVFVQGGPELKPSIACLPPEKVADLICS